MKQVKYQFKEKNLIVWWDKNLKKPTFKGKDPENIKQEFHGKIWFPKLRFTRKKLILPIEPTVVKKELETESEFDLAVFYIATKVGTSINLV